VRGIKGAAIFRLVQAAFAALSWMSFDRAMTASEWVGELAFRCLPGTRRLALEHLELVFGDELRPSERREIVRRSMRDFAKSFCEMARMDEIRSRFAEYVEVTGWAEARDSVDRGAIVCTGHLGNWEVIAPYFTEIEKIRVAAVARRLDEPRLNELLVDFRTRLGIETILRDSPSAGRQILKILKDHGLLAMLIDQDTKVASITVPFLGRPARTPVAPAALAVRRRLPILVAYNYRRPEGGIRLVMEKPLWPDDTLDRDAAVRDLTVRVNDLLGQAIRAHPTQWPWWHRRWRRPPQPRLDPDATIL
jgi:KDO2-lipid IV(A) lauroyltransferase